MKLNYLVDKIKLKNQLHTSYGIVTGAENAFVSIEHNGLYGYGEAVPVSRYVENIDNVLACFNELSGSLGSDPWAMEKINQVFDKLKIKSPAAKSAINMALYDWIGKSLQIPLYKMLGLNNLDTPYTSYTIGVDNISNVVKKVLDAKDFPIIKLKIGKKSDIDVIKAIREISNVKIRVDANGSWEKEEAIEMIDLLAKYNVEFVEQPVKAHDLKGLKFVREHSALPIIADESCLSLKDIPYLAECADGVNIKLAKCGGISEALRMIYMAKACGLKVMLGCFLESSLAVTAAAQLTPLVDYADLDTTLFIKEDKYDGLHIKNGKIILPNGPGLGVIPRSDI